MKQSFTTFIALAMTLACAAFACAATVTVSNTDDSGGGSLRQALADANDGDTIDFSVTTPATITLTSGQLVVDKSVTISGLGAANLAVNGNAADRVFYVSSGLTVTISGLTIENGSADRGGGIYNEGVALTVSDCIVNGNSGGGICNIGSESESTATLTINNSTLSGNSAYAGGGILNFWMTVTVTNSTLSDNSASLGGGIYNNGEGYASRSTVNVNNSTLSGNSALGYGGGAIYNDGFDNFYGGRDGRATVTVTNSTLSGNSAVAVGGAIWNDGLFGRATATVTNSTFSDNSAGYGGGIYSEGTEGIATVAVTNSTFSGNSAFAHGGGIYNYNDGGYYGSATLTLGDTILNGGSSGENIYNDFGAVTSLGYNLSSDDAGGFLTATGDQINTDPMLGPLQDNGGSTFTHQLLSGSPAIDAGDLALLRRPTMINAAPVFRAWWTVVSILVHSKRNRPRAFTPHRFSRQSTLMGQAPLALGAASFQ
jgi:predicted outer membrane repeat protein